MIRRRNLIALPLMGIGIAVALVALAVGHDADPPSPASSEPAPGSRPEPQLIPFEEQENFRAGVPKGPKIDFCPTPKQVEAHWEKYGFDYKPNPPGGLGCSSRGAWTPPDPPYPDPPDEHLSDREICLQEKRIYLNSEPLNEHDGTTRGTFMGRDPHGGEFIVGQLESESYAKELEGMDIHDFARSELGC